MQNGIHPNVKKTTFKCACGNVFESESTLKADVVNVDICSKCHPFFSGKQSNVRASGRVEKFMNKYGKNSDDKNGNK